MPVLTISHGGCSRNNSPISVKVLIRADASSQIGTGHVMRCLTLSDALREQGAECHFVCREHEGHLMDHISSRGYELHVLPKPSASAWFESDLTHASWLGVDWQTDANQTREALGTEAVDWLIVDHYALDHRWESVLRSSCKRIMVIDDLADRQHNCDLLLDQNYGSSVERYSGLVPADCTQCYGPEYALLKPIYAERRAQLPPWDGQARRVLIYFGGGTDAANLTRLAVQAFQALELAHFELDIVVGAAYEHQLSLEELVTQRGNATIHRQLPDLADLMAIADFAIGAGGATTWERCCMGLPSIVISIAENQRPACEALSADKLIDYLGQVGQVTPDFIRDRVLLLLKTPYLLRHLTERGMELVDGKGAERILNEVRDIS
jgi:UDP-2,4-diacetamido-2,4,6-trideoxy-beta-L-altropyranose hydrolase